MAADFRMPHCVLYLSPPYIFLHAPASPWQPWAHFLIASAISISCFFFKKICLLLATHMSSLLFHNLKVLHVDLMTSLPPLPIGALLRWQIHSLADYAGIKVACSCVSGTSLLSLSSSRSLLQSVVKYFYMMSATVSTGRVQSSPCLVLLSPANPLDYCSRGCVFDYDLSSMFLLDIQIFSLNNKKYLRCSQGKFVMLFSVTVVT